MYRRSKEWETVSDKGRHDEQPAVNPLHRHDPFLLQPHQSEQEEVKRRVQNAHKTLATLSAKLSAQREYQDALKAAVRTRKELVLRAQRDALASDYGRSQTRQLKAAIRRVERAVAATTACTEGLLEMQKQRDDILAALAALAPHQDQVAETHTRANDVLSIDISSGHGMDQDDKRGTDQGRRSGGDGSCSDGNSAAMDDAEYQMQWNLLRIHRALSTLSAQHAQRAVAAVCVAKALGRLQLTTDFLDAAVLASTSSEPQEELLPHLDVSAASGWDKFEADFQLANVSCDDTEAATVHGSVRKQRGTVSSGALALPPTAIWRPACADTLDEAATIATCSPKRLLPIEEDETSSQDLFKCAAASLRRVVEIVYQAEQHSPDLAGRVGTADARKALQAAINATTAKSDMAAALMRATARAHLELKRFERLLLDMLADGNASRMRLQAAATTATERLVAYQRAMRLAAIEQQAAEAAPTQSVPLCSESLSTASWEGAFDDLELLDGFQLWQY